MSIIYPHFFWLFLSLPLFITLYTFTHIRGLKSLEKLGYGKNSILTSQYRFRSYIRLILLIFFLGLIFLALVEFKWGVSPVNSDNKQLDAAIVLDISNSMLADDVNGSRLERCKDGITLLIDNLEGTRFSFTLFKGDGVVYIPLTEDTIALKNLISPVHPGMISSSGSDLESALKKAHSTLADNQERNRAIFLFTDGESLSGNPMPFVRELNNKNIRIFIYGVGGVEQGSPINLGDNKFLKDDEGETVLTSQNASFLEEMARVSKGEYINLSDIQVLGEMGQNISSVYNLMETRGVKFEENYQYRFFLFAAILILILYKLMEKAKWNI